MQRFCFWKILITSCRAFSKKIENDEVSFIRTIGILAHIDAGKTTTTERMLYYAGKIQSMGEVHHGNTVTDFLAQERERGITISSAAVSFMWKNFQINLVDTPGHIDFTMEVERTLSVLDGAVVILDASAGVEAQTVTVWRQADRFQLPRIVYINKMDRKDANLTLCMETLEKKFNVQPVALHRPLYDSTGQFEGVIDIVTLKHFLWNQSDGCQGRKFQCFELSPQENKLLWEETLDVRSKLVEKLADFDEELAEQIILTETHLISAETVLKSLKKVTIAQKIIPVLCGSSYKNVAVQLLMDAVIVFLPSPDECNKQITHCFQDSLCARAFKVIHDSRKRPITYFRIYTGELIKEQKIYNMQKEKAEQSEKLMIVYADESKEVAKVTSGNIAAVRGLKVTNSGDFITTNASAAAHARRRLTSFTGKMETDNFAQSARIPAPVFFCSIEAPTPSAQIQLDSALQQLQREDPSLTVNQNETTGQTEIGGMGELHLEVIKNRVISEYKIDVELGCLYIAYKETPHSTGNKDTHELKHMIGSKQHYVKITLSILCKEDNDKTVLLLDRSPENASNVASVNPRQLIAIRQGVEIALTQGPKLRCPVINTSVMLHWCQISRGTSETMITAAACQCVQKILKHVGTYLLEPIMQVQIITDSDAVTSILTDLSRRRGIVQLVTPHNSHHVIDAQVPLAELMGYATDLRTISSGSASFSMELDSYKPMCQADEEKTIKQVTGFDV